MTVYNLGSINADYLYQVPHIPAPGETLAATHLEKGLGGKGANQSVAIRMSGAEVLHIGAVGEDGAWLTARLRSLGVNTSGVAQLDGASGHGIISIAPDGENAITLFPGTNITISSDMVSSRLSEIGPQDWLVLQNETSQQRMAAALAKTKGASVVYSAAPFDADVVASVIDCVDILCVNEHEAASLIEARDLINFEDLGVGAMLITYGAQGAAYHDFVSKTVSVVEGHSVNVVDTTGAGDTFCGYFVGRLSQGDGPKKALNIANKASALQVTRPGTADSIPTLEEVLAFKP